MKQISPGRYNPSFPQNSRADAISARLARLARMLCAFASVLSFSPTSRATARHRCVPDGACTASASSGRTSLLTAASPPSDGHSIPALVGSANALSCRAALLGGWGVAAGLAAPRAAWAADDAAKARAQMEASKVALDELLQQWDDIVAKVRRVWVRVRVRVGVRSRARVKAPAVG